MLKDGYLCPKSKKISLTKEREGKMERARRKKGVEGKKTIVLLSGFILASFEMAKTTA